jgi:hypothetical protein
MKIPQNHRCRAFTLLDAILIGAVMTLLVLFLAPLLTIGTRAKMRSGIHCAGCLKEISIACEIWQGDNGGKYPMAVPVALGGAEELLATGNVAAVFQVMSNELATPKILKCPEDSRHKAATNFASLTRANISYFVALTGSHPSPVAAAGENSRVPFLLAGDANLRQNGQPVRPGIFNLWSNTAAWTPDRHGEFGNVLAADSSVQTVRQIGFASSAGTYMATNSIVAP